MSTTTHSPAPPPQQRPGVGRLQLPPAINTQLAAAAALEAQKLFSPAIQTARQAGFPLGLPGPGMLQTPLQTAFMTPLGRPMHRAHPSLQFGAPGIPMTPGGQHQFPPHLLLPAQAAPFQPRSRRAPSISTGGPPKAPLGGPQRKPSPLPPLGSTATPQAAETKIKITKRVIVKLPVEHKTSEDAPELLWTRQPLPHDEVPEHAPLAPPEINSMESHPMDWPRNILPNTLDVFLPGKPAWDEIKRAIMEDKLSRLGVGKPQGPPGRLATALPHGRAASISSPADPALLFFKLNKLQEQQNASAGPSHTGTPSPQPPSISPQPLVPRAQNRHGHSMSMAPQGANYFLPPIPGYESGPFNPFGPNAILPRDQAFKPLSPVPMEGTTLHAPQGIVPSQAALLLPQSGRTSVASSRPDFARGFGLEIPEEDEEDAEAEPQFTLDAFAQPRVALSEPLETDQDADGELDAEDDMPDDATVPARSRIHSRHQSKLSAALSLRSVGGVRSEGDVADLQKAGDISGDRSFTSERIMETHVDEAVAEWTGSEDMRSAADVSAAESEGEWSNPSDEERARQDRLHRRMLSNGMDNETQTPRRLPNFPRPPVSDGLFNAPRITAGEDDDVISNPSEEEAIRAERSQPGSGRGSGLSQLGPYDGLAHSRVGSGQSLYPESQPAVPEKKITLNPNAKPFVFGGRPSIIPPPEVVPPVVPPGHGRQLSFNSTLNAAAQEFKPSFTFRPPPGVKPLAFPEHPSLDSRPLPQPPIFDSPARAMQGREKRVRRSESIESDDESLSDISDVESRDGRDNIATWSFPFASKTTVPSTAALNPTAKEFKFMIPRTRPPRPLQLASEDIDVDDYHPAPADDAADERSQSPSDSEPAHLALDDMSKPVSPAALTPTLPDFKHPVSTNTVPASLFKKAALANQDDGPTRPQVRSRLSSREIMASLTRRSSLDDLNDLNVPSISRKVSKTMLIASDSASPAGMGSAGSELLSPLSRTHHRASISRSSSVNSMDSFSSDEKSRLLFKTFADLLEDKFETFKRELVEAKALSAAATLPTEIISELVATIRNQADLSSDDNAGRTGTDLALIRSIIEESHLDIQRSIQADIRSLVASTMVNRSRSPFPAPDVGHLLEDSNSRTLVAIDAIRSQLTARLDGISEAQRLQRIHISEAIAQSMAAATNLVGNVQQPIDIDSMTAKLAQAVKPNISQLIDLTSDKKETAMLIVKHLSPLLEPILQPTTPRLDTDAIAGQIAAEISRIVPPVDQHSLKEQVADLVVERLDARLTVRDRAVNGDALASRVLASITPVLDTIQTLPASLSVLTENHSSLAARTDTLIASHGDYIGHISSIPPSILAVSQKLEDIKAEILTLSARAPAVDESIAPALAALTAEVQASRARQDNGDVQDRLLTLCGDIQGSVSTLSSRLETSLESLQASQVIAQSTRHGDDEELRSLLLAKADLEKQVQTWTRTTGQLGLEKDSLQDRVAIMEAENRLLRAQLEEQRTSATERDIKLAKAETRAAELSESLAHALTRLSSADDAAQANQKRMFEFDSQIRELTSEKHQLRSKVDSLELKVSWSERDKEAALRTLAEAQKERDAVVAQQEKWDDLSRTAQHIETLTKLMTESESEELRELKRIRDRSKVLEGEHQALQKRFKDQETKLANLERSSTIMRQNIATSDQKAAEWEKRAKDFESELETVRDRVERTEDLRQQVEADYSLLKSHVEEKELEEAAYQEREQKLRAEAAQMQIELAGLRVALEKAKETTSSVSSNIRSPQPMARSSSYVMVNGRNDRPSSRATIYPEDARSGANTPTLNGKKHDGPYIPPADGAWASIHAPPSRTVHGITYFRPPRAAAASPTPSVLSTVTRRDDGWWDAD